MVELSVKCLFCVGVCVYNVGIVFFNMFVLCEGVCL